MVRALTLISAALLFAPAAFGATVTVIQGEALVRRGDGYESIKGVADLAPGDTVLAKAGSSAKVTFANGCMVFLGMGMVFSVPSEPPCGGAGGGSGTTTNALQDTGAPAAQDWSAATQTTAASEGMQTNVMPYLLGAAAIGGIAAGALAFSGGGGGGPPASP